MLRLRYKVVVNRTEHYFPMKKSYIMLSIHVYQLIICTLSQVWKFGRLSFTFRLL